MSPSPHSRGRDAVAVSTPPPGISAMGDGALPPPLKLFIVGETEEYFVSLTKQHFTGA